MNLRVSFKSASSCLFFSFLFVKLSLFFCSCILILLILRNQVVHVTFCFSEFHFIHAFSCVPMQEGLSSEHGCELLTDSLEQFLDCSAISNESSRHLQASGRDVANCCLVIIGNPFDKVAAVLVLHI